MRKHKVFSIPELSELLDNISKIDVYEIKERDRLIS